MATTIGKKTGGSRSCFSAWRAVLGAALGLALTAPGQKAEATPTIGDAQTINFVWRLACDGVDRGDNQTRAIAARGCAAAFEEIFPPDVIHSVLIQLRIASASARGGRAAIALPYRMRAYRAALRILGPDAPMTGQIALELGQTMIIAPRMIDQDVQIADVLATALRGFDAAPRHSRYRELGYRRVATAYADSADYETAVTVLQSLPERTVSDLTARDWEQIGRWRYRAGDPLAAADAYEAALGLEPSGVATLRLKKNFNKMLFAAGAFDRVRRSGR